MRVGDREFFLMKSSTLQTVNVKVYILHYTLFRHQLCVVPTCQCAATQPEGSASPCLVGINLTGPHRALTSPPYNTSERSWNQTLSPNGSAPVAEWEHSCSQAPKSRGKSETRAEAVAAAHRCSCLLNVGDLKSFLCYIKKEIQSLFGKYTVKHSVSSCVVK